MSSPSSHPGPVAREGPRPPSARSDPSVELLVLLIREDGYFPDFLTTTPAWDLTPAQEAERLRHIDDERFRIDMRKVLDRSGGARRVAVQRMLDHPERARAMIAEAWLRVWEAALAPVWPHLERLLRADIAVRSRRIAEAGIGAMIGTLHERVSWADGAVRVRMRRWSEVVDCRGSGLVLVPSVMSTTGCSVLTEPPATPTLFYGAQGVTADWARRTEAPDSALAALLGPARAASCSPRMPRAPPRRSRRTSGSHCPPHRITSRCSAMPGCCSVNGTDPGCCTAARHSGRRSSRVR